MGVLDPSQSGPSLTSKSEVPWRVHQGLAFEEDALPSSPRHPNNALDPRAAPPPLFDPSPLPQAARSQLWGPLGDKVKSRSADSALCPVADRQSISVKDLGRSASQTSRPPAPLAPLSAVVRQPSSGQATAPAPSLDRSVRSSDSSITSSGPPSSRGLGFLARARISTLSVDTAGGGGRGRYSLDSAEHSPDEGASAAGPQTFDSVRSEDVRPSPTSDLVT